MILRKKFLILWHCSQYEYTNNESNLFFHQEENIYDMEYIKSTTLIIRMKIPFNVTLSKFLHR